MEGSGKFDHFNVITTNYKYVAQHGVQVNVLLPKELAPGLHPLIVRFHGGGYVSGSSLFPDWFPIWQVEMALSHNAIVISPNYRFLPESNGQDIMQDVEDFWKWLISDFEDFFQDHVPDGVTPDFSRILTAGESAGGYLSIQLAINHSDAIRACIGEFPSIDLKSPAFTEKRPNPRAPTSILEEHLSKSGHGSVVSSDMSLARFPLVFAMSDNGIFLDYFGTEEYLFPLERVENGEKISPLLIMHGLDDDIVPVDGSKKFVKLVQEKQHGTRTHLSLAPGGHGFHEKFHQDHPALKEGLDFITRIWLA